MKNKFVYTPGPTYVRENVRLERAVTTTNPDVDVEFVEFYKNTCDKIASILHTKNPVYILNGEGILGLEAACASLTEPDDRVLVIDNGIFGRGFKDFVEIYGGQAVLFESSYTNTINVKDLKAFLEKDHNFKYATIVHCDTPTGVMNDISKICPLLNEYGILSVVDSVAGMVGEEIKVDEWKIDIIIGGSQKALSAPPGLTIVALSENAQKAIDNRKLPVTGFYCNLNIWKTYYEDKWFPYTMPISDIMCLDTAVNNILDEGPENVVLRHNTTAIAVRKSITEFGLQLFLENGYSNNVTAVKIPKSIGALNLKSHMENKYNTLVTTTLKPYENELLRIGHMGENSHYDRTIFVLNVLDKAIKDLGFESDKNLVVLFNKYYEGNR